MLGHTTKSPKSVNEDISNLDKVQIFPVSNKVALILQWILYSMLCQLISMFGICTNIINIICFVKQGFKDSVNVSLMSLAVADMGSLITISWTSICVNPHFNALDLPFDPTEFQYLTGGMPHAMFTRVSAWITAVITMERCLCITAPLKTNSVVTSKRVTVVIICIFIVLPAAGAPVYVINRLDWKFFPARNKTLIGLVSTDVNEEVEKIYNIINNFVISFSSFLLILISTIILATTLRKKSGWLKKSTNTSQWDKLSRRNKKVAKMVVMISTLFIVCFVPVCVIFLAMSLEPTLTVSGQHRNLLMMCGGFGLVLETVNSSVNIFFYFHMSSKYRETFSYILSIFKAKKHFHNSRMSTSMHI